MTQSELDAVIRLLDDPDNTVYKIVEKKLMSAGPEVIPHLESAIFAPFANSLMQSRIQKIVPKLELEEISGIVKGWKNDTSDLHKITWAISRLRSFTLKEMDYREKFLHLLSEYPHYELDNYTALERVKILNYAFYNKLKFSNALEKKYLSPEYCFVSNVLDTKIGNPISLAIVYLLFARSIGLPIFGVNLPKNFILAYLDAKNVPAFYINPFNKGAVLGRSEIDRFLKQQKIKPQQQFYEPCSNETIVLRLLYHLEIAYKNNNLTSEAENVRKLISLFDSRLDAEIDWL